MSSPVQVSEKRYIVIQCHLICTYQYQYCLSCKGMYRCVCLMTTDGRILTKVRETSNCNMWCVFCIRSFPPSLLSDEWSVCTIPSSIMSTRQKKIVWLVWIQDFLHCMLHCTTANVTQWVKCKRERERHDRSTKKMSDCLGSELCFAECSLVLLVLI